MRIISLLRALLFKRIPIYVHYGVTHRCNLTCRMCGLWKTGDRSKEVPLSGIEKIARNLSALGTAYISIGGGEPFVREDIPDILKIFRSKGIEVRLLTNGMISNRKLLDEVLADGLRHISISLDTCDPKMQAYICDREDAWDRAMETIEIYSHHLKKNGGIGLFNTVVSRLNLRDLPKMVDLAEKYGFYCSFVPLERHHFGGVALSCADTQQEMGFTAEDRGLISEVYLELLKMKAAGRKIFNSTTFLEYSLRYFMGEKPPWRCLAGRLYFSIDPEGNFSICHRFKGYSKEPREIPASEDDFPTLFASREYLEESRLAITSCPGCLRPCWSEVSLAFTDPRSFVEAARMQLGGGS